MFPQEEHRERASHILQFLPDSFEIEIKKEPQFWDFYELQFEVPS